LEGAQELPVNIRVGAFDYPVEENKEAMTVAGTSGAHLGDEQKILVDPTLAPQQYAETLLHESIHAIIHQTNLREVIFESFDDPDKAEERLVRPLSTGLYTLLRNNPGLVDLICGARE